MSSVGCGFGDVTREVLEGCDVALADRMSLRGCGGGDVTVVGAEGQCEGGKGLSRLCKQVHSPRMKDCG